jgi:dolichyl-phosphate beta-glucosyltransferase
MAASLSVVLPVHDEEPILAANVSAIVSHLATCPALDRFEIILACNGCSDDSVRIARRLGDADPARITALSLPARGLGHAIREGIAAAAHETVMFYAVDLPFGLSIFDDSLAAAADQPRRVVIGSKGHPRSVVRRGLMRQLFSGFISLANRLVFALDVNDTQGSILFPKEIFRTYQDAMDSPGAFFQAQIIIYGHLMGCTILEIPVHLIEMPGARRTRFRLVRDGMRYLLAIAREKRKLQQRSAHGYE